MAHLPYSRSPSPDHGRPAESEAAVNTYADALPAAQFTLCRLHAGQDQLTRRIMHRGQGAGWAQPGDPLRGQPVERLLQIAYQATRSATALEDAAIGDVRIDTDARTVEQVADKILAKVTLPGAVRN